MEDVCSASVLVRIKGRLDELKQTMTTRTAMLWLQYLDMVIGVRDGSGGGGSCPHNSGSLSTLIRAESRNYDMFEKHEFGVCYCSSRKHFIDHGTLLLLPPPTEYGSRKISAFWRPSSSSLWILSVQIWTHSA